MHEMPIVRKIVKIAERHARENGAKIVKRLVLQIGELSSVVPDAVRLCYPMCTDETILKNAVLEIEIVPAIGICQQCSGEYNLVKNEFKCPECQSEKWEISSGRELLIKEIEVV